MSQVVQDAGGLPATFESGHTLTAEELNALRDGLVTLVRTHTHAGADQGVQLQASGLANGAVCANHLATGAVQTDALQDGCVTRSKLAEPVTAELKGLADENAALRQALARERKELETEIDHLRVRVHGLAEEMAETQERLARQRIISEHLEAQIRDQWQTMLALSDEIERMHPRASTWAYCKLSQTLHVKEFNGHNILDMDSFALAGHKVVRLRFAQPYLNHHYTVIATVDQDEFGHITPALPVTVSRRQHEVLVAFVDPEGDWIERDLRLNLIIFGEVEAHDAGARTAPRELDAAASVQPGE